MKKKIAILGATSHIAKGLISRFVKDESVELYLFGRSLSKIEEFLQIIGAEKKAIKEEYSGLKKYNYDAMINCIGLGTPSKVIEAGKDIFELTEKFDSIVLDYLRGSKDTLCVNFSSGAVYGKEFSEPAGENSLFKLNINMIEANDYYSVAKINSEAKHRANSNLNIVDLRVFGYFSRFIDLDSKYLITEIINCIKNKAEFVTGQGDFFRDFIHPEDLFKLVGKCIDKRKLNDTFDAVSSKPVKKSEIVEYFAKQYGLKCRISKDFKGANATGTKDKYYSLSKKVKNIGFTPEHTSLDSIVSESRIILG